MSATLVPHELESMLQDLGLRIGRVTEHEVWCLCPAHERRLGKRDNKATNFSVNKNTGDAFCFGCGFQANLQGLVVEVLGVNHWEALTWLREHGASLTEYVQRVNDILDEDEIKRRKASGGTRSEAIVTGLAEDDPDLEFVLLEEVPDDALASRGLTRESADAYRIRWKDGQWVLPFIDARGRVRGWQIKDGSFVNNYPKGRVKKSQYVFGMNTFTPGQRAYIVESPLDAARIHAAGIDGALATFGAGVSRDQVRLIAGATDDVVLVMDNDEAGWRATAWLRSVLLPRTRRLYIATYQDALSKAKDPGDLSDKGIELLLETAESALFWRKEDYMETEDVRGLRARR